MFRLLNEYNKWKNNWDDLCNRCGMCCYTCIPEGKGEVTVDLSSPCAFLNEETHLCTVYEDRFKKYPGCGKLTLVEALFNPRIPPSCAYVRTFRRQRNNVNTSN